MFLRFERNLEVQKVHQTNILHTLRLQNCEKVVVVVVMLRLLHMLYMYLKKNYHVSNSQSDLEFQPPSIHGGRTHILAISEIQRK